MIKKALLKILDLTSDFWEKHHFLTSAVCGILTGLPLYFNWLVDFRVALVNIITYSSTMLALIGIFLTLFITLQKSAIFERLRTILPNSYKGLIRYMKLQFFYGIFLNIDTMLILVAPSAGSALDSIGVAIWGFLFWGLSFGSCYVVKLISDLLLKDADPLPTVKRKE